MHGTGWYARSTDLFQMARPSFADGGQYIAGCEGYPGADERAAPAK